jgi:hypothetical protein
MPCFSGVGNVGRGIWRKTYHYSFTQHAVFVVVCWFVCFSVKRTETKSTDRDTMGTNSDSMIAEAP